VSEALGHPSPVAARSPRSYDGEGARRVDLHLSAHVEDEGRVLDLPQQARVTRIEKGNDVDLQSLCRFDLAIEHLPSTCSNDHPCDIGETGERGELCFRCLPYRLRGTEAIEKEVPPMRGELANKVEPDQDLTRGSFHQPKILYVYSLSAKGCFCACFALWLWSPVRSAMITSR
jgi:hypothetical protein